MFAISELQSVKVTTNETFVAGLVGCATEVARVSYLVA